MHQYICPKCNTELRREQPIPAGKKIKCPKCAHVFEVTAGKVVAKSVDTAADAKAAANLALDEEFADRNPYTVVDEQEEDEEMQREKRRAASGLVRDRFKKSARGPAQREVVRPANFLMASGIFTCIGCLIFALVAVFPLIFKDFYSPAPQEGKKYSETDKQVKPEMTDEQWKELLIVRLSMLGGAIFGFIWGGLVCIGAFKMNSLESYTWAMIGSIMGIFPVLIGIWGIVTLRNPAVIAGFEEEAAPEA